MNVASIYGQFGVLLGISYLLLQRVNPFSIQSSEGTLISLNRLILVVLGLLIEFLALCDDLE